jgi:outer membrane lipoprotein SlyB
MEKRMVRLISSVTLIVLSGCATLPTGPSVRVMPGSGKTFEQFQADDANCRQWAGQQIGISPQGTLNQNTATGAVTGTLIGAALGAAIGAASGNPAIGAAIGAGSGLLVGTASGANAGNAYGYEAQRRYDNTYIQCMYAKGNQVPGTVRYYRPRRRIAPPPPPPDLNSVPPDYIPGNAPPPPSQQ